MTIEEYDELLKYRKLQTSNIISNKKRMVWEYFRKIMNVSNVEKNINDNILYIMFLYTKYMDQIWYVGL